MSNWTPWLIILMLGAFAMLQVDAEVNYQNHKLSGIIKWKQQKRPFCNAFTGCGRKRSSYPPFAMPKSMDLEEKGFGITNEDIYEGLSDLIDINAEPAVENVQKQIMSQAKIFEAIKEASKEIIRQRNKQKLLNQQRREQFAQEQNDEQQQQQQQQLQRPLQQQDKIEDGEMV